MSSDAILSSGETKVRLLLFSCPYFRRGWVIQEVALPKVADVHWGHAQINIHWLGHVAYYLLDTLGHEFSDDLKAYDGLREFDSMYSILEQTQYSFIDRTFGRLLMETRGALFKDPRDRIYGMLGLRNSFNEQYVELKSVIQPDYEASLLDCYKATTDTLLLEHQDIIVLTLVQHRNDIEPDWPSYVPHYEQWLLEDLSYQSWRCSGNTAAVVSKVKDGLVLQGFRVDTITSVMGGYESSHSDVELQLLLRQLHAQFAPETVAWTATGGRTSGHIGDVEDIEDVENIEDVEDVCANTDSNATHMAEFAAFLAWDPAVHGPLDFGSPHPLVQRAVGYSEETKGILRGRRFFATAAGTLGMGHRITQPGDVVVVFLGGRVPFVLRPVGSAWRLVGVCYVFDIMEGQAFLQWDRLGRLEEGFCVF